MGTFVNQLLDDGKRRLEDANKQALAAESNPVAQKRNVAIREPRVGKHGIIEDKPKDDFYSKLLADSARRKEDFTKKIQASFIKKPSFTDKFQANLPKIQQSQSDIEFKKKIQQKAFVPLQSKLEERQNVLREYGKGVTDRAQAFQDASQESVKEQGIDRKSTRLNSSHKH